MKETTPLIPLQRHGLFTGSDFRMLLKNNSPWFLIWWILYELTDNPFCLSYTSSKYLIKIFIFLRSNKKETKIIDILK